MKKLTVVIAVLIIFLSLSACGKGTYEDGYEDGYANGLFDGKSAGYSEGVAEAQHDIAFYVDDDLWSLANDIEDKYGIHPEEAIMVLANYADDPEAITEDELNRAIWAVCRYYYDSNKVINGIEDYWIE